MQSAVMLYEMHAHTKETSPCSQLSAKQMVRLVKDKGYACLMITDHFSPDIYYAYTSKKAYQQRVRDYQFAGYRIAAEEGYRLGLTVLLGIEARLNGSVNDYLVYGVTQEELLDWGYPFHMDIREFATLVRSVGGFIAQAHPFRPFMTRTEKSCLDGIEVFNAHPQHNSHNDLAMSYAKENGFEICLAGSDIHREDGVGGAGMLMPAATTTKQVAAHLRNGLAKIAWPPNQDANTTAWAK